MNWRVVLRGGISQTIGRCGLSRQSVVRVLTAVHVNLPVHADPDFFLYYFSLWDGGTFHTFEFRINDFTAPGYLFVVRMKHTV